MVVAAVLREMWQFLSPPTKYIKLFFISWSFRRRRRKKNLPRVAPLYPVRRRRRRRTRRRRRRPTLKYPNPYPWRGRRKTCPEWRPSILCEAKTEHSLENKGGMAGPGSSHHPTGTDQCQRGSGNGWFSPPFLGSFAARRAQCNQRGCHRPPRTAARRTPAAFPHQRRGGTRAFRDLSKDIIRMVVTAVLREIWHFLSPPRNW